MTNDEFASYACFGMAIMMLGFWLKASMDGTTDEFGITHDHSAHRGDGDFEAAQHYRLFFAAVLIATGIYGLVIGFD